MSDSRAKSVLGKSAPHGEGTRIAEYIETPLRIHCASCEYLVGKKFCRQDIMAKDKQVPTDKTTGLKIIDPIKGCCRFWEPEDKDDLSK
jgi:hypothetical protein